MRAAVIIPTYNERENIGTLVWTIKALPRPPAIYIVDDNSPDGTGHLADALARKLPEVYVHHRPAKLGLGTAHTTGMKEALAAGYPYILTMDADFSHHPCYIPDLLEASRLYDVVIGSRYVDGSGTRHCGIARRALSRTANAIARLALDLEAHDCTAGFRCYRRQVLESIDLDAIFSDGYSFLVEMLYRVQCYGFRIGEVPILFEDRQQGQSKISRQEIFKAAYTVARLGWEQRMGRPLPFSGRDRERTPRGT